MESEECAANRQHDLGENLNPDLMVSTRDYYPPSLAKDTKTSVVDETTKKNIQVVSYKV